MRSGRLGIAVIGTGAIARRFAADMRYSRHARIVAVGARDAEKARALAAAVGPEVVHGEIETALAHRSVDAIYVATANAVHAMHARSAMRAGKAVLVEKPFATSAGEAADLADAARAAGVFAMEAMWARFTPGIRRIKAIVDAGELGAVRRLHAEIAYRQAHIATSGEPGGALLDLGVYPISLALHLLGPETRVLASGRRDAAGRVVRAELLVQHGDAYSSLSAAWDAEAANRLTVVGSDGLAEAGAPLFSPPVLTIRRAVAPDQANDVAPIASHIEPRGLFARARALKDALRPLRARRLPTLFEGSGLQYQVDHMAECLRRGWTESPIMPLDDSCRALRVVDAALAQIA